jgi:hypothetical protein
MTDLFLHKIRQNIADDESYFLQLTVSITDMLCSMIEFRDDPKMTDKITPTSLAADIKNAVEWGECLHEHPTLSSS